MLIRPTKIFSAPVADVSRDIKTAVPTAVDRTIAGMPNK
jgi:hypothetical protein